MDRNSASDADPPPADPAVPDGRRLGEGLLEEEMGPSSSLAHLYRGEIHRMRFWRERLDQTTYWAIVIMSAILTWTFSSPSHPHYVLLLGLATLAAFLVIEARRFRGYDLWRGRVRTLQKNVFAPGLDPSASLEDPSWRRALSRDYRSPTVTLSTEEAIAHRLRRVYLFLLTIVVGAWLVRVTAFAPATWPTSAAVGRIPGLLVTGFVAVAYLVAVIVALRPRTWHVEKELGTQDPGRRE